VIVAPTAIPPESLLKASGLVAASDRFENDYDKEVYSGDLGVVSQINIEAGEPHAQFDGREVTYGFGALDELVLAYATTIHKSQGLVLVGRI
jgi:hypothetical protein